MHIFSNGPHGSGLGKGDPVLDQWPGLLENWLRAQGLLTVDKSNQRRQPVTGNSQRSSPRFSCGKPAADRFAETTPAFDESFARMRSEVEG